VARSRSSAIRAPTQWPRKYFESFDEIVDHCCYVWITLIDLSRGKSCPSRAAMANRDSGSDRERFRGARGAVEKIQDRRAHGGGAPEFCKMAQFSNQIR
jgi:hypothetical protein